MLFIDIKTAHGRSNFLKTIFFFSRNICKIRFKIPRIFNLKNFIIIFTKNLVNIAIRMEERFYTSISINVFVYVQIAQSGPKHMIREIEGVSNIYS